MNSVPMSFSVLSSCCDHNNKTYTLHVVSKYCYMYLIFHNLTRDSETIMQKLILYCDLLAQFMTE